MTLSPFRFHLVPVLYSRWRRFFFLTESLILSLGLGLILSPENEERVCFWIDIVQVARVLAPIDQCHDAERTQLAVDVLKSAPKETPLLCHEESKAMACEEMWKPATCKVDNNGVTMQGTATTHSTFHTFLPHQLLSTCKE